MWKVGLAENRLRAHFIEPRFRPMTGFVRFEMGWEGRPPYHAQLYAIKSYVSLANCYFAHDF